MRSHSSAEECILWLAVLPRLDCLPKILQIQLVVANDCNRLLSQPLAKYLSYRLAVLNLRFPIQDHTFFYEGRNKF